MTLIKQIPRLIKGLILFLFPMMGFSQTSQSFKIIGTVQDVPDNTKFYLIKASSLGEPDTIQTVLSKQGKFEFIGSIDRKNAGELHFLKLDTTEVKLSKEVRSWIRLVLDNSIINIKGNLSDWPFLRVGGSVPSMIYENYVIESAVLEARHREMQKIKDTIGIKRTYDSLFNFTIDYIKRNDTSVAIPLIMLMSTLEDSVERVIFNALPSAVKNSFYGNAWKRRYNLANERLGIKEGGIIPDFEFKSGKGESLNILQAIKGAKYTLIDFWASWCAPCRAEIPNLKKAYEKFHASGFNIIGIAVKDEKTKWEKAVIEENTGWFQGRDDDMEVWDLFGFVSIPAYVIVDEKGRLIAYQCALSRISSFGGPIRGENLFKKLDALIGTN